MIRHPKDDPGSGHALYRWNPERMRWEFWWDYTEGWYPSNYYKAKRSRPDLDLPGLNTLVSYDDTWAEPCS